MSASRLLSMLFVLVAGCMTNNEETAAQACANTTAACYCTSSLSTDLRCVDCSGTPAFLQTCIAASGDVCCLANDNSICQCRSGSTCSTGSETEVASCTAPSGSIQGDLDVSDSDNGPCTSIGFCVAGNNQCGCGTSCINFAVSGYICGYSCNQDADCTSRLNPQTGLAYTQCEPAVVTATRTYGSYCSPP